MVFWDRHRDDFVVGIFAKEQIAVLREQITALRTLVWERLADCRMIAPLGADISVVVPAALPADRRLARLPQLFFENVPAEARPLYELGLWEELIDSCDEMLDLLPTQGCRIEFYELHHGQRLCGTLRAVWAIVDEQGEPTADLLERVSAQDAPAYRELASWLRGVILTLHDVVFSPIQPDTDPRFDSFADQH